MLTHLKLKCFVVLSLCRAVTLSEVYLSVCIKIHFRMQDCGELCYLCSWNHRRCIQDYRYSRNCQVRWYKLQIHCILHCSQHIHPHLCNVITWLTRIRLETVIRERNLRQEASRGNAINYRRKNNTAVRIDSTQKPIAPMRWCDPAYCRPVPGC